MSRKANYFVIGLFVLVGIATFIGAVAIFGSGALFRQSQSYVAFFDGSVKGLKVGAPVMFRGVKIGEVKQVLLEVDHRMEQVRIPVIFEIFKDSVMEVGPRPKDEGQIVRRMIEQGLRAKLEMESIVTGVLAVNLNFYPNTAPNFVGRMPRCMEIPTLPSTNALFEDAFGDVPISELVKDFQQLARNLAEFINSEGFERLPGELSGSAQDLRAFLKTAQQLAAEINSEFGPLSKDLRETAGSIKLALADIQGTFAKLQQILDQDSPARHELQELVREIKSAAVQFRELSEFLERNPDALLRGK